MTQGIEVVLAGKDGASAVIAGVNQQLANTGKQAAAAGGGLQTMGREIQTTGRSAGAALGILTRFNLLPGSVGIVTQSVAGLGVALKGLMANPIILIATALAAAGMAVYGLVKKTEERNKRIADLEEERKIASAQTEAEILQIKLNHLNNEQGKHREYSAEWVEIEKEKIRLAKQLNDEWFDAIEARNRANADYVLKEKLFKATSEKEKLVIERNALLESINLLNQRRLAGEDVESKISEARGKAQDLTHKMISLEKQDEAERIAIAQEVEDEKEKILKKEAAAWRAVNEQQAAEGIEYNDKAFKAYIGHKQKMADADRKADEEWQEANKKRLEKESELLEELEKEQAEYLARVIDMFGGASMALTESYVGYLDAKDTAEQNQINKEWRAQENALKQDALRQKEKIGHTADAAERRAAIEDQLAASLINLERDKQGQIDSLNREMLERNKLLRTFQIAADAAAAIWKGYAELGPYAGTGFALLVVGKAGLDIAAIQAQEYQTDPGEVKYVSGPRTLSVPAVVHGGETISRGGSPGGTTVIVQGDVFGWDESMDRIGQGLYFRSRVTGQKAQV
jgi:hypothetical protein